MVRCLDFFPVQPPFDDDGALRAWQALFTPIMLDRASARGHASARQHIADFQDQQVTRAFWNGTVHLPAPDQSWRPWLDGAALAGLIVTQPNLLDFRFEETPSRPGQPWPRAAVSFKQSGRYRQGLVFTVQAGDLFPVALWRRGRPAPLLGAGEWATVFVNLHDLLGQAGLEPSS